MMNPNSGIENWSQILKEWSAAVNSSVFFFVLFFLSRILKGFFANDMQARKRLEMWHEALGFSFSLT